MGSASITLELHAMGDIIATIDVPFILNAGELRDGYIPLSPDTVDLTDRVERGIEAFKAAVKDAA